MRKREEESKTGGNLGEKGRFFYFRVFPTIWELGTGYSSPLHVVLVPCALKIRALLLLAVYLQLDLRADPWPSKTRLINEIRDLWNWGRGRLLGRDLTFLFLRVFSKNSKVKPSPDRKMIILLKFDNLFPSLQNDASSQARTTKYWENLVLALFLTLESNGLY